MPFVPKNWEDAPSTNTPINAAALEDMETRVTDYTDDAVEALHWKAPAATFAALPGSGNVEGDVRLVLADETQTGSTTLRAWVGGAWVLLVGGAGGGGNGGDFIVVNHDGAFAIGDMLVWDGAEFDTTAA